MAIPVAAGSHEIRLRYHTPGRMIGVLLSLLSVGMLASFGTDSPVGLSALARG